MDLLPQDGTPVLNRVMRVMLSRSLECPVSAELYFSARDLLVHRGRIGRLRGQGGQLFLAPQMAPPGMTKRQKPDVSGTSEKTKKPAAGDEPDAWPEAKLMAPLRTYLEGPFRKGLDLSEGSVCIVHDTSTRGPRKGQWAQPDYVLVSALRFKFMPGCQVDVHSFELKTESGGTIHAVHEALAQTRFTHFGHLVWHLPQGSRGEVRLAEIEKHCEEHGIGLIRMRDPSDFESFEVLVDPVRKESPSSAVDGFLEARLTRDQCEHLARAVHGAAP